MTRQGRTVLVMTIIGVAGVAVLAVLASRYGTLLGQPRGGYRALPGPSAEAPAQEGSPRPEAVPGAPGSPRPPLSEAPASGSTAGVKPGAADPETLRQLDGFANARAEIRLIVEKGYGPITPRPSPGPIKHAVVIEDSYMINSLVTIRLARDAALKKAGLDMARYAQIRAAYRDWIEGKPVADSGLAAAFEQRKEQMIAADLGGYDPFDF